MEIHGRKHDDHREQPSQEYQQELSPAGVRGERERVRKGSPRVDSQEALQGLQLCTKYSRTTPPKSLSHTPSGHPEHCAHTSREEEEENPHLYPPYRDTSVDKIRN